jgi:hypothetical protein
MYVLDAAFERLTEERIVEYTKEIALWHTEIRSVLTTDLNRSAPRVRPARTDVDGDIALSDFRCHRRQLDPRDRSERIFRTNHQSPPLPASDVD